MSYRQAVRLILDLEGQGQFTDHPADRGGPTRWGITQATYDGARRRWRLPGQSVEFCTLGEATRIYEEDFWIAGGCDKLLEPLATVHFDGCVQHPPKDAVKLLQRALGVEDDGIFGSDTRRAAMISNVDAVCENLLWERQEYYALIVRNEALKDGEATQADNILGWTRRVRKLRRAVLNRR